MELDEKLRRRLENLKGDFLKYGPKCLKVKDEDTGQIVPFIMRDSQKYLHDRLEDQRGRTGKVRALVLKGRRQGVSTYIEGRFYWKVSMTPGLQARILTHQQDATDVIFAMTQRFHEYCPAPLRPSTKNESSKALTFDKMGSEFMVATAGSKNTGRSANAHLFHGCLGVDTQIVDGVTGRLVAMEGVSVGSFVRTHTGVAAAISFVSRQKKAAKRVVFKGLRDFPLIATGEHRFWTRRGWADLDRIEPGEAVGFPVFRVTDAHRVWKFKQPDRPRPQNGGTVEHVPDVVVPNYHLGRILGLYLAEGTVLRQSGGSNKGTFSAVSFAVHEREAERTRRWLDEVSALFKSHKTAKRDRSKTTVVTAYGRSFAQFVYELCGAVDSKRFPVGWQTMGEDFVRGLLHGYLSGDGHFSSDRDRRISATSIRSAITIGVRDALAALGYGWATIGHKHAAVRHGRNEKEAWVLRLCGSGVERMSAECGKPFPKRRRADNGNYGTVLVKDGYAWIPVVSIEDIGAAEVMDFEVASEDHSYCTLHCATHNSESAFWEHAEDHMGGIGQIIPNAPGTEIILESTANGIGNLYHRMWQDAVRGISDYEAIFIPWFWEKKYRAEVPQDWSPDGDAIEYGQAYNLDNSQLYWRHRKIVTDFQGDSSFFDQEYPATPELGFRKQAPESLFRVARIERAMKCKTEAVGPKIMGLDPAESEEGDDTVFILRQGRVVTNTKRYHGKNTMETVALAAKAIEEWGPQYVNVDAGGLGSGIADRLIELGHPVNRVLFGERAIDVDLYALRRDEMWGEMVDWFKDEVSLPDDEALKADLCGPKKEEDSRLRFRLESKKSMKTRGLKSPDGADALALTFALPIARSAKKQWKRPPMSNWRVL